MRSFIAACLSALLALAPSAAIGQTATPAATTRATYVPFTLPTSNAEVPFLDTLPVSHTQTSTSPSPSPSAPLYDSYDDNAHLYRRQQVYDPNACAPNYLNCAANPTIGVYGLGLCCPGDTTCAPDSRGNVACCPTSAGVTCTGTINPVGTNSPVPVASIRSTTAVAGVSSVGGFIVADGSTVGIPGGAAGGGEMW